MEIRVREMIQAGEVPGVGEGGGEAYLSESLTQTGHDVEVVDGSGHVVETLQVKAGAWPDVRSRLDEYAQDGIPVAVTTETARKAGAAGFADAVIDTGISGGALTDQAAEIVNSLSLGHAVDELIPELALVAVMASAGLRIRAGQPVSEVRRWLTDELVGMGVANAAGVAVQLLTGLAFFRPVAVLGTRWGMARVRTAAEAAVTIRRARDSLSAVTVPAL